MKLKQGRLYTERPAHMTNLYETTADMNVINVLLLPGGSLDSAKIRQVLEKGRTVPVFIDCANTVPDALQTLTRGKTDVILIEAQRQPTETLDAVLKLQVQAPGVPIITLCSPENEHVGIDSLNWGAQQFLVWKNLDGDLLFEALSGCVERRRVQKYEQKQLESERETVQQILECAPVGIVRISRELKVKDANPAFCNLFGLKHEKIANKHICVLVSALTPGQFHEAIAEDNPIEINGYHLGPTPNHQESGLYCDLIIWPVKSTESVVTGFVLIIKDVTDRLKVSQQRDEFITALAHDLKVPLAGAERFLESVLNGSLGEIAPQLADALMTLRRSNKHMLWMVQNLLLTYQEQEGIQLFFMEAMNVKEVVEECLQELKPFASAAKVELASEIDDDLPMILADRIGIRRVLINLTDNAIKASPADSKISLIANRAGSGVCILVKDQGKGIASEVIPTLFKRFWKEPGESKSSSNTGLGLYVCKRIIEAHGGKIRCQSRLGEGASFIINLSATVDFGVDD
ncbi:MAG: hypothetical protein DKT66_04555 [Candidatus Melainabacteria bacterium]|nr:MAG: hypothetical protein DKT66_04555 [Candidatus Melainabacteria bacterium]